MLALQDSGLFIRDLNLFGETVGQNVLIHWIREIPDLTRLSSLLQKVKSLSLSLSSDHAAEDYPNRPVRPDTPRSKLNIAAVSQFLGLMSSLEALDLLWYKPDRISNSPETFFFETCFASLPPTLRSCTLRGLYIDEESLLTFLQQTSAKRITFQALHLRKGIFASIVEVLTRETRPFEYFQLDNIYEYGGGRWTRLEDFKTPGEPKFLMTPGCIESPTEIIRQGDEVPRKLEYRINRPLATGLGSRWVSWESPGYWISGLKRYELLE